MGYNELIKHFQKVRSYIYEFYIFGLKSRNYITYKSKRSYDNERRRLESYLNDYMSYQYQSSKYIFISIDCRLISHNPLYVAFLSKSFTDKDITLHFMIFDILHNQQKYTLKDILNQIDYFAAHFKNPLVFDESTLRKKLQEYQKLGLIQSNKENKQNFYQKTSSFSIIPYKDALSFYSEAGLLGVVGFYMLYKINQSDIFRFKHHYIIHAIDSEIIYQLLLAMNQKRNIQISSQNPISRKKHLFHVLPLKIYISSQTGRTHLLAYSFHMKTIKSYRIDYMNQIILQDQNTLFDDYRQQLHHYEKHIWSIQCHPKKQLEHVEFIIYVSKHEDYIYHRLLREKRHGTVTNIDENHYRFEIDVYDTLEMVPWIRTFICRITQLHFSNRTIENQIKDDIMKMYQMYQVEGDDHCAV